MSLIAATRSESAKQFTTSMWWILAVILAAYVAFTSAALAFALGGAASGSLGDVGGPPIPADGLAGLLYSTATGVGYVFPVLIGTLIVTAEYRHKTLTPTFLATPRRSIVLAAKLAIGVLLGVLYGVVGIVAAVAPGAGLLAAFGLDTELGSTDIWAMLARMILASILWVFIGVGIGVLVRNQVGAIVGVLVFTQFIEPIARTAASFVDGLGDALRFLPGAASDALVGQSIFAIATPAGSGALAWWAGGLVLLGYAAVLVVLGALVSWRRDVS